MISPKNIDKRPSMVILRNIMPLVDVDDDLFDEVQEICKEQCGLVIYVKVVDIVLLTEPVVCVFSKFWNAMDTVKASICFD